MANSPASGSAFYVKDVFAAAPRCDCVLLVKIEEKLAVAS